MAEEPSHVKQLSLNHVCKIGLTLDNCKKVDAFDKWGLTKLSH